MYNGIRDYSSSGGENERQRVGMITRNRDGKEENLKRKETGQKANAVKCTQQIDCRQHKKSSQIERLMLQIGEGIGEKKVCQRQKKTGARKIAIDNPKYPIRNKNHG